MAISQKLGLSTRLAHRLILTPSLQQAIKLLPLTTLELAEVLEQEVVVREEGGRHVEPAARTDAPV